MTWADFILSLLGDGGVVVLITWIRRLERRYRELEDELVDEFVSARRGQGKDPAP